MTSTQEALAARIRYVETATEIAACYGLMRQLRPHLGSASEFVERWSRQLSAGYRVIALWHEAAPVALVGFRIQENLARGRHLYVDDLVTDETMRGKGNGHVLMERLKEEVRAQGCTTLVLDTPLTNTLGHRFYYRHGFLATALRFTLTL